jgi:hypothetical protein
MSEDQVQGFGAYHPEAAGYAPFNDAMAAWRNQVKSMQDDGTLPQSEETPLDALQKDAEPSERVSDPEPQGDAESPGEEPTPQVVPDPEPQSDSDEATVSENEAPAEVYDPAEHTSPDVLYYLKVCDYNEALRVLESEENSKNRKGILNLKQEILDQAWKTGQQDPDSTP